MSRGPSPTPEPKDTSSKPRRGGVRGPTGLSIRFIDVLGWVILVAWVISFVADIVNPHYDPPPILHAMMMAVVTAAFTSGLVKRSGGGD